jgi:hypothetical protein
MGRLLAGIVAVSLLAAGTSALAGDALADEADDVFTVVNEGGAAGPGETKFALPTARLHKARVRIVGPSFVSGYTVTTARGQAEVSASDISQGSVTLMVDEGVVSVEGTGWGRKVCQVRGQARVGVELTLGCAESR